MTRSSRLSNRIAIHGCVSPAIAAEALRLTLDMNNQLETALLTVEDERACKRLRDCAVSLLTGQISALMRPKEVLQ